MTHLIDGEFQSDKYPTCPRGKVPLSCRDVTAQDLLWTYAQRRRPVDAEFSADLEEALRLAGFTPPVPPPAEEEEAEYAIVEIMGHRRHVGRVLDVERFGTRMLRVDVPKPGGFAEGFTSHFYSGGSIFGLTPTDRASAEKAARPRTYDQPALTFAPEDDDGDLEPED